MLLAGLLNTLCNFYTILIIIYCLFSWFPHESGLGYDIYHVLETICEPYLGVFRKMIPSMGGIDFSPVIAIIVLELVVRVVARLLIWL